MCLSVTEEPIEVLKIAASILEQASYALCLKMVESASKNFVVMLCANREKRE